MAFRALLSLQARRRHCRHSCVPQETNSTPPWSHLNNVLPAEQVLMRVARCRPQPTDVPQGRADSKLGKRRGRASVPSPPMTSDVLRALGEVLEEVELLGGGNVAAITNEPTLAALLQVNVGIAVSCLCLTSHDVCKFRFSSCKLVRKQALPLRGAASKLCPGRALVH